MDPLKVRPSTSPPPPPPDSLVPCSNLAFDFGGSLVKVVLWEREGTPHLPKFIRLDETPSSLPLRSPRSERPPTASTTKRDGGPGTLRVKCPAAFTGELRFLSFPDNYIPDFIEWVKQNKLVEAYLGTDPALRVVNATGGGARKYAEVAMKEFGVRLIPKSELSSAVNGLTFLLTRTDNEIFSWDPKECHRVFHSEAAHKTKFPYFLVSIGSGVSIIKVSGVDKFVRLGGSALGGGTFWGLCKMLLDVNGFDDVKALEAHGDGKNVDFVVGDIYGGDASSIGLEEDVTASFFGKLQRMPDDAKVSPADVAQSLLNMVTMNMAQMAYLCAKAHAPDVSVIFFSGSFLRDHPLMWEKLSSAIDFWSKGSIKAMFLLHDGYLGALGSLLDCVITK